MGKMTMKERILAVLRGEEIDQVPFIQYDGIAAPNEVIWSVLGRNNMGLLRWSKVHRFVHPNCHVRVETIHREGLWGERTILYTPAGELTEERLFEPTYGTASVKKHYVEKPEDYPALIAYLKDTVVLEDLETYLRDQWELGDDGIPMVAVDRTPYQQLWVQWVSLLDLCLHMVDCPDLVEECVSILIDIQRRIFRVVWEAHKKVHLPFVNFPDNITAPVIGERNFRKYCVPLYNELADMLADDKVPVVVHMDGDLKPLWKAIGECRIMGLDSFSPPPDNDTSAAEAAAMWPEKRLMLNFPSSVHLAEPETIYNKAGQILEEAGHTGRLWIQISENVPPGVWKRSFPQIVRAIQDFGKPQMG
jgi:hypothetical protein